MPPGTKLSYLPDFEGRTALYRKLDSSKREIRILTLWPNEDFSAPLECSLEIRTIGGDDQPAYCALSYYWGSANDLEHVMVHGSDEGKEIPFCEVPVTRNLTSALRYLRKEATTAGEPLAMWTDALCINQRDARERSDQVSIMLSIFESSRSVWVSLNDRGYSAAAGRGLKYVADLCDRFRMHKNDRKKQTEQITSYLADQDRNLPDLIESIAALLELPYWRRGWILQEVCHYHIPICLSLENQTCKTAGFVPFRAAIMVVQEFARARGLVSRAFENTHAAIGTTLIAVDATSLKRQFSFDVSPYNHSRHHKLLDLAQSRKLWHTSDPRDNVFVLCRSHPALAGLKVNYDDTVEEVFETATLAVLINGGTWSRLSWFYPAQSPFLPSWVIDFSPNTKSAHMRFHIATSLLGPGKFDSSASSPVRGRIVTPGLLRTAAFVCDEIEEMTSCPTYLQQGMSYVDRRIWWEFFELARRHKPRYVHAMIRTFCAGLGLRHKRFTVHDLSLFGHHPIGEIVGISKEPRGKGEGEALSDWRSWVCNLALDKRFFTTRTGRMGLAPHPASVGDQIAIFASGDLPFVVRKVRADTTDAYIMLGNCYLDGKSGPHLWISLTHANTNRAQVLCMAKPHTNAARAYSRTYKVETMSLRQLAEGCASMHCR